MAIKIGFRSVDSSAQGEEGGLAPADYREMESTSKKLNIPGMVLAAVDLLERNPNPTEADIRNGLAGNLCRCTGYMKIFESVLRACQKGNEVSTTTR